MQVERFRRIVGSASVVGFALFLLLHGVIEIDDSTAAGIVETATAHRGALFASALLLIASSVLLVPAIGAIVAAVKERGKRFVHAGAVFGVLGALGHMGIATYYLIAIAAAGGGNHAATLAVFERVNESPYTAVLLPMILSFGVGVTLLAVAAWRAGLVGAWALAVFAGVWALEIIGRANVVLHGVRDSLALLVFAAIALRLLRGAQVETGAVSAPVPQTA